MEHPADSRPRFSLVLPAYNEEDQLPGVIESIQNAMTNYHGHRDDIEIILADNQSTDHTAQLAHAAGWGVVAEPKRCIAAVRNAGVRAAQGPWVGCVDADTRIHPESFNVISRAIDDPTFVVGMTGSRLDRDSFAIRVTTAFLLTLATLTQMDTGIVFFRRADWEAIGGYDEAIYVAEDIDFLQRMGALGKLKGLSRKRIHGAINTTSARKFDRYGDWHIFWIAIKLLPKMVFHKAGSNPIIQNYWYGERETPKPQGSMKSE